MLAPWRGLSAGRAEMLTRCPPWPALRKLATAARRLDAHEIRFIAICCCRTFRRAVGDRRPGETAGDVHRSLDWRQRRRTPNGFLIGEIDAGGDRDLARREAVGRQHGQLDRRHMAMRGLDQGLHHGNTQRSGAARDDDMAILRLG